MGPDFGDPSATVLPDQRNIETYDPSATVMPLEIEAPKPRATRGGAAATRAAGATMSGGEPALSAGSMESARAELRAKAAAQASDLGGKQKKKGASWVVWVMAFLVLGGIGFGVAWFLMNPPDGEAVAAADAAAATEVAEDASEQAAVDAAGEAGGADVAVAASADAAQEAVAADMAAASADVAPEVAAEVAVAAADVAADAGAAADTVAVAAVEVVADTAAAVADAQVAAVGMADVVAVVPEAPDAAPAAVVVPKVRNPIEATRLNEDGLAKRKAGDHAAALKFYAEALAADPEHVWARYNYACELALAGRPKDALNELTTLYKLDTADSKRALGAARKDSDFRSIKESGQFFRLTNF